MEITESDPRTFASVLKKERQPDIDVIVKNYRWPVHSHIISAHGSFGKLCNDARERQNGERREVHLDDEPVIIAHLVRWWYIKEYDDAIISAEMTGLAIRSLLKHGKVCSSVLSERDDSDPEPGLDNAQEDADWEDLPPISLHAKMYLIARKYGITELSEKAVYEITETLGFEKEALLPCLAHFFATNSPEFGSTDSNDGSNPTDDNVNGTTTATTRNKSPAEYMISEQQDPELWKVLAKTTGQHAFTVHTDPFFRQIMTCNPLFHWAVTCRVITTLDEVCKKLENTPVEPAKVPKKRGRKKQEDKEGSGSVDDNNKKKRKKIEEGAVHAPKKTKKEPQTERGSETGL
ncbi:hypothetical protein AYL99_10189 [Fonsecaea erecta]|uniref:BTB domain-containing protein n=1 Tax=Fonsecaea erecta TaxID=1367422 RepID=A0A178Z8E0_9EURO|nr:hypothetical protein AYL99_10189 [Fonsecaea erecta]OAP56037.1 hypothetical protein AYL99_10189 [Fonsecaea erecta]